YGPTGLFDTALKLEPGDLIEIGCGVRKGTTKHPKILNVEYIRVLQIAAVFDALNPPCPVCCKRMKSEGKAKGFQCDRCKHRDPQGKKILLPRNRDLQTGLYIPDAKAHRHLTKPLQRYGREKKPGRALPPLSKFLFIT